MLDSSVLEKVRGRIRPQRADYLIGIKSRLQHCIRSYQRIYLNVRETIPARSLPIDTWGKLIISKGTTVDLPVGLEEL